MVATFLSPIRKVATFKIGSHFPLLYKGRGSHIQVATFGSHNKLKKTWPKFRRSAAITKHMHFGLTLLRRPLRQFRPIRKVATLKHGRNLVATFLFSIRRRKVATKRPAGSHIQTKKTWPKFRRAAATTKHLRAGLKLGQRTCGYLANREDLRGNHKFPGQVF